MSKFAEQLKKQVLFLDGAMGTSIHGYSDLDLDRDYLGKENCTEILVQTRPEVIAAIHESFLEIGSDGVETDTFGANKLVFAEFDLVEQTYELNKLAAEIAREACKKHTTQDKPRFVIGSLGPGTKLVTLGHTDWDALYDSYREQVRGLIDGGSDVLLIETSQDILQVKCAVNACLDVIKEKGRVPDVDGSAGEKGLPIMVQVTIETTGTMLLGTEISAAAMVLQEFPIISLGLNCATGPVEMSEHIHWLGKHWPRAVSVLPNAGLPTLQDGQTVYPLQPKPFAEKVAEFVEQAGVNIVGGCCGTTPEHIGELVKKIGTHPPAVRGKQPFKPGCTSLYSPTDYRQDTTILNVGERCNASGSRAFKRLLEAEDWDEIVSLAREQMREGSHVLDINVDYAGRDNAADMAEVVSRIVQQVNAPLMLDSTQPATIEAGLKHAGGKCLINSANLEDGEEKFAAMCRLARRYGAGLVLGTIDEDPEEAMARTADRKEAIAARMHDLAVNKYGLKSEDIMFDPLVLPISTGMDKDRRSALETIEGTRRIARRFPRCQITCGLSNVSFGLKPAARQVLNSVFLHDLIEAGLTSAILHVSKILPCNRIADEQWQAAVDLIYNRPPTQAVTLRDGSKTTDPLQIFVDLFGDDSEVQSMKQDISELPLEERLQKHIIDGEKQKLTDTLEEAMKKYTPLQIINDHLLAGMKVVGDLFGSGQMQLPFVLQSAEVMKMAVAHLEPHMEKIEGQTKGSIVLATVKGDVHDIGKNLVDIILTNNGYTVYNLGIKQPVNAIIEAWQKHKADAIGLSGLLVKSVTVMEENLHEFNAQDINVPMLLGGAALSRHYCDSHLRQVYQGKVYHGKDAFEGLRIMDYLKEDKTDELDREIEERLTKRADAEAKAKASKAKKAQAAEDAAGTTATSSAAGSATATMQAPAAANERTAAAAVREAAAGGAGCGCGAHGATTKVRSNIRRDVDIPTPPFWGDRVVEDIPLEQIYPYINRVALYRGQWQFRKGRLGDDEYKAMIQDKVDPIFDRLAKQCREERILQPRVAYGYYPCNSDGDDLIIYDPKDHDREIERFTFPRQQGRKHLCISDFFRDAAGGEKDVIGMTCVTVGDEASKRAKVLFESNQYQEYLYLHGFGVECAEALAELWHKHVRQELGIGNEDSANIRELFTQHYRGSRYSFGYPACPEMSDQDKLFRLLKPDRIGCVLTENWQIDPEQSTSAIIVHHPEAKYFNIR